MIYLMLLIMVLVSVAFVTLFERKILGYVQLRKGPNKVLLEGLFQPLADGVKLFTKDEMVSFTMNKFLFIMFPMVLFYLMLCLWFLYMYLYLEQWEYGVLGVVMVSSLSVYGVLGMGWSSNSNYALLGSYRSVVQTISYEVSLVFVFMSVFYFSSGYSFDFLADMVKESIWLMSGFGWVFLIWGVVMVAELNRAPFDFVEGESELVSGFNVEYGGVNFAFIFLAEYGSMLFFSYLTMLMFSMSLLMCVDMLMMILVVVWVRGTFPRFRYDSLMMLTWKRILPAVLLTFYLFFMMKLILL